MGHHHRWLNRTNLLYARKGVVLMKNWEEWSWHVLRRLLQVVVILGICLLALGR
jgi:hypothetical protein